MQNLVFGIDMGRNSAVLGSDMDWRSPKIDSVLPDLVLDS